MLAATTDWANTTISVVALIVAVIALVVAAAQYGLGERQTDLAQQQADSAKRQEAIAAKQAEIVEKQDRILQERLSRTLDLRVRTRKQNRAWLGDVFGPTTIELDVLNGGNKTADGFYWELFISRELVFKVSFVDEYDNRIQTQFSPFSEEEVYDKISAHYTNKLYRETETDGPIARMLVQPEVQEFTIKWRLRTEDGLVPTAGLAKIHYRRIAEHDTYAVMEPWPPGEDGHENEPNQS